MILAEREPEQIEVGVLERQTVLAMRVTREEFMGVVEDTFAKGYYMDEDEPHAPYPASVRDKLMPIVETMMVFPMSAWVAPARGCGCVVGEYLIAADLIEREVAATPAGHIGFADVQTLLAEEDDGDALLYFGSEIDATLRRSLDLPLGSSVRAILIED